ncbi:unnamed protein product, partial [Prorocentrum cordatum]
MSPEMKSAGKKNELFQMFMGNGCDEQKYLMAVRKCLAHEKSTIDTLSTMKVREMRTAGYSEESIQRIVALNEKNNWWRADELLPDVKEERRYVVDAGSEMQNIVKTSQTMEVSGKAQISREQAEDLTTAGLLSGDVPGSLFEGSLADYLGAAASSAGGPPEGKTDEEKQQEKEAKEKARAQRLAARSPLEKAQDLMEEVSQKSAEADRYALRCEGIPRAKPTKDALEKFAVEMKQQYKGPP